MVSIGQIKRMIEAKKEEMINEGHDANFSIKELISIFIVVLLAGYLLPTAFGAIFNASTGGWDAGTVSMFNLIPIIAVIVVIVGLVYLAVKEA